MALAMLMFTTSSGVVIDMHFCGGKLKTVGVFSKAKTCMGESGSKRRMACSVKTPKNDKSECSVNKKQCCQSKTLVVQNDNTQNQDQISLASANILVLYIESVLLSQTQNYLKEELSSFNIYRPPLVPKDIQVLYQSFLI